MIILNPEPHVPSTRFQPGSPHLQSLHHRSSQHVRYVSFATLQMSASANWGLSPSSWPPWPTASAPPCLAPDTLAWTATIMRFVGLPGSVTARRGAHPGMRQGRDGPFPVRAVIPAITPVTAPSNGPPGPHTAPDRGRTRRSPDGTCDSSRPASVQNRASTPSKTSAMEARPTPKPSHQHRSERFELTPPTPDLKSRAVDSAPGPKVPNPQP